MLLRLMLVAHTPVLAVALAALALAGPTLRAQEAVEVEQLPLRLEDAWSLALDSNIGLSIQERSREAARYDALGSWGAFDPVFSLSATYTEGERPQNNTFTTGNVFVLDFDNKRAEARLTTPVRSGGRFDISATLDNTSSQIPNGSGGIDSESFTDTNVAVSFVQPLLRGAGVREATTQQERSRLQLAREQASYDQAREQLLLDVHVAYWDLVAALEEVGVRERALALGNEQLRQESERLRVGVGTEVDVLQAETNVATREEQLLLANNTVDQREDALKLLVFGEPSNEKGGHRREDWNRRLVPLTELPTDLEHDAPDTWLARLDAAFEQRPDLAVLRADIEIAEIDLVARRSDREASLDLTLSISSGASDASRRDSLQAGIGFDFPTYSASLSYEVPLRNRSARYAERAARASLRSRHLAYSEAENRTVSDLRNGLREVYYQARAVEAASKSREFAERQLEAEQVRYREGLSTTFQVLEFQQTLTEALSSEQTVRANLAKSRAQLLFAEGRLAQALGIEPARADQ
jgi:outer membrane protein